MRLRVLLLLFALLAVAGCRREHSGAVASASLIFLGGHILTLTERDASAPATAVAVAGGRVVFVGDDAGARDLAEPETRVIDLAGATLLPGFTDSHCHLYGLGAALAQIDCVGTVDAEAVAALVDSAARAAPSGAWLQGRGWDQNDWKVKEYPHRTLLDRVSGDHPVLLRRIDGHAAWANSKALRLAGITADTPDPDGGQIVRDAGGKPTGILIDNAADLVLDIVPEPDRAEKTRRIERAIRHCQERGLTGVHEAGIDFERLDIYRELDADGRLGLRIYGMFDDKPAVLEKALAEGPFISADGMVTARAVKLYADGALGSRGAMLLADYADKPGWRGLPVTPRAHLEEVARTMGAAGFQICTHAIGDGANRMVLDIYSKALGALGFEDRRWRIEHAQILSPQDIPRFAKLGVIAAMQPTHCTSDMDWVPDRIGQERARGAYAWKSLLDSGARLCFGTDFPIERVDPLLGLYAARTRMHPDGSPPGGWHPEQRIDGRTAVELYTAGSAYAAFQEDALGRVAPGYLADFTVLDGDPSTCGDTDVLDLKVLYTVVDGKIVYANGG